MPAHSGHEETMAEEAIVYLGETFLFKGESDHYSFDQCVRAERLLQDALAGPFFATYAELMAEHERLTPPRTCSSTGGYGDHTALGQFTYLAMRFPGRNEYRVLVYQAEQANSAYRLIDDFSYYHLLPPSLNFCVEDGQLTYRSAHNIPPRIFPLERRAPRHENLLG